MKLSIIVPMYNVEHYLRQCLDSIYKLGRIEKEVILVNDGSKDETLNIAKEYGEKYKEITTVIDQPNSGVSITRNKGLEKAVGDYIYFFDGDDFLNVDIFQEEVLKLFSENGETDILYGNRILYFNEKRLEMTYEIPQEMENKVWTGPEYMMRALKEKFWNVQVGTAIYKRELLIRNNIDFPEKRIHEDELFTIKVLNAAKKVRAVNKIFFYYMQREGSIMKSPSIEHSTDVFKNAKDLIEIFKDEKDEKLKEVMFNRIKKYYLETMKYALRQKNKEVYKEIHKEFKKDCKNYFFKMKKTSKDIELYLICYFDKIYYLVRNGTKEYRDKKHYERERKRLENSK